MIRSGQISYKRLVLVVDDQEINRDALEAILEDEYDVITGADGKEALSIMKERRDDLSIVLLDLFMPGMDGFEVLGRMQEDELLQHIPVIVMTAEKKAELKALKMGAADFITKPFDMYEVIRARVKKTIELSEGRKLISAAEHDRLTGLYNRGFFFEYANRLFQHHSDLKMDAAALNIEQFHSINAVNGREFGDEVLRSIADEIREFLSETQGIACRFEADRFYIYCVPQPDYRALLKRFQKRAAAVSDSVRIHVRMGVRPWKEGVEPIMLFDQAGAACNMVRGDYQNSLMIYDEDMRMRELMHHRLMNDLNNALEMRQFRVFYQPKYDIQCDPPRLASAEALIRWQHPDLGMISPAEFIPLFEGNGLITMLDRYVWEEAARQVAAWQEEYGFLLPVSVNLSRADVFAPTLEERLTALVRDNGLNFRDVKLEITESAYTDNAVRLLDVVRRLREIGFEIEMDDFGSGYSSLNMLSDMPIDVLKMDMKFIRNIENSETDLRLVQLILDIARYLKLPVVAEGVETERQLDLLRESGCEIVQGYYFSKPLPPEKIGELIRREIENERKREK